MELSHWRIMQRTNEKLDFKPLSEGDRFDFDDYDTVAEIRFTREMIEHYQNDAEKLLFACFAYTNSLDTPWYNFKGNEYCKVMPFRTPCRSSSVGDIFQNMNKNQYWMVDNFGYVRVYPPVDVYLEMARRRKTERKDAESFEAPKTPKWKSISYKDEDDGKYKASVPTPSRDSLYEKLYIYEEGMEPYDIELSQYLVLDDKVVCFVGSYRESFYNQRTQEYRFKKKRHWFGLAYQTSKSYAKLTMEYIDAEKKYDHWWEQVTKAEKLQMARFKHSGGDTILPEHGKERRRLFEKEPIKPWRIVEDNMWEIDTRNWQRGYNKYDWFVEGGTKKDVKERILEQAQEFISTEPDWWKNNRMEMAKRRKQEMGAEETKPSLEAILDFVYERFANGDLEVKHEEIAEHFGIETKEVYGVMREENCREKYIVEGEDAWGDYFMRYKGIPMYAYFSPSYGYKFYSIKNPFVQARAKGRSRYDDKNTQKARLRKIIFGADSSYCENCYAENGLERRTFFKQYSFDEREYEQVFCRFCGDAKEPKPIEDEDERLEGADCYMCGKEAKYIFEDLPTGAKPFCTEKCLCDYAGYSYMGEGYYGLTPIGGGNPYINMALLRRGKLDWRKNW